MIDNLTSISNENFTDRPISRFISQISASRAVQDPEFLDADDLPCLRLATVALGGGADQGAGQLSVRDYEVSPVAPLALRLYLFLSGTGSCTGGSGIWIHYCQKNRLWGIWIFTNNILDSTLMQLFVKDKSFRYGL